MRRLNFYTIPQAADRVGKSTQTIRNWLKADDPLPTLVGLIREDDLLEYNTRMSNLRGRPVTKKSTTTEDVAEMVMLLSDLPESERATVSETVRILINAGWRGKSMFEKKV